MPRPDSPKPIADHDLSPTPLADEDITSVRVDRRSFLSRAVAAGSLAAGAALTSGCNGGTDSDSSDSDAEASDSDSPDNAAPATDSDSSDSTSQ